MPDRFVAVEFAVNDDPGPFVLAGDRLIAAGKIGSRRENTPTIPHNLKTLL
jgi:hypothetical protein